MERKNLTALMSLFVRAYHYKNSEIKIFSDEIASLLLSEEEYEAISTNLINGTSFFFPLFNGSKEEALKEIVNKQLGPSVLARSSFTEESLNNFIKKGYKQYLIFASGYDTSMYKEIYQELEIFEIDRKEMIEDKIRRLDKGDINYKNTRFIKTDFTNTNWKEDVINSEYDQSKLSFNSLLGISYYLSKAAFTKLICSLSSLLKEGSQLVFDYPTYEESAKAKLNENLARGAKEEMKAKYSYQEIKTILETNGFSILKHLDASKMTEEYFSLYNKANQEDIMSAPKGVAYCLAEKAYK